MKFVRTFKVFGCLLLFVALCGAAEKVTVTGARVNVRAVADLKSEIVGQVVLGDVLTATGTRQNGMVEIVPPASVAAWVYGELVRNGEVAASTVRVRSGPGIGFRSIGKISKGFKVDVIETSGDWLKISPPESCRVWISAEFVRDAEKAAAADEAEPAVEAAPAVEPGPEVKPTPPPAVEAGPEVAVRPPVAADPPPQAAVAPEASKPSPVVRPAAAPSKPRPPKPVQPVAEQNAPGIQPVRAGELVEDDSHPETLDVVKKLKLVRRVPQGKAIRVRGVVRMAGFLPLRRPSSYRLVVTSGNKPAKTGCYLIGDQKRLSGAVGKSVLVVGRKYWVQGVREPVVLVSGFCKPE